MKKKIFILVDWENLRRRLTNLQGGCPKFGPPNFDYNNMDHLKAFLKAFLEPDEELRCIYFYLSESFVEAEARIIKDTHRKEKIEEYKENYPKEYEKFKSQSDLIQKFKHDLGNYMGFPKNIQTGKLKFKFEKVPCIEYIGNKPVLTKREKMFIEQKQVDMLLGIDLVCLPDEICKNDDRILLFCQDSDLVPALKRKRDVRLQKNVKIFIGRMKGFSPLPVDLKQVCDGIRECSVEDILKIIPKEAVFSAKLKKTNRP
ncbi:NYN domain-containing protein [Helicobacter suis]|uniref:NYN domain-containing protein n=1 Tax=Helicobacter suis TaxID=104628 RepID=UPI0013D62A1C|nr:NYN domain-containing protein [Helicobacter suis]